jgi:hypothetical protein
MQEAAGTSLTMISTEAIENMLARGKRARGRRLGSAVATTADTITANWKKSVHHSQRQVLEHTCVHPQQQERRQKGGNQSRAGHDAGMRAALDPQTGFGAQEQLGTHSDILADGCRQFASGWHLRGLSRGDVGDGVCGVTADHPAGQHRQQEADTACGGLFKAVFDKGR